MKFFTNNTEYKNARIHANVEITIQQLTQQIHNVIHTSIPINEKIAIVKYLGEIRLKLSKELPAM